MDKYINEEIEICCNAFQKLLLSEKYISIKLYEQFLDKYKDTIELSYKVDSLDYELSKKIMSIINDGYKIIEKRNKKFLNDKLIEYKDYFDNMFKDIDSNILLDEEQRRAILTDEDYSLVIAGAGSGKTTTMAAKVKYLIDKCHVPSNKIILLAFTNKAALELSTRINGDFKLSVEVLTFHKLGMKFLRKIFNNPIRIVGDAAIYRYVANYVENVIFPNKVLLKRFISAFDNYVSFDDNVFKYETFNDYYDDYVMRKYEEKKNNLDEYIIPRINNRLKQKRGIDGNFYKSQSEVMIANYLYEKGLNYTYEKVYPYKLKDDRSYSPDFTVSDGGLNIYIEYYGLTRRLGDDKYTTDDINTYRKLIDKKRQLHKKYGTDLIELYSDFDNGKELLTTLEKELNDRNISGEGRSKEDIFYKIMATSKEVHFFRFISLVMAFIKRFKEKGYVLESFDDLAIKLENTKEKDQLIFIKNIFKFYNNGIHKNYEIDFNDMINYAYLGLEKVKEKNNYLEYDYLIIDEYQDISMQRYNLAKKLSDIFNAKIVAVGDDWQAIYSFSGSDIELFTHFADLMGYAQINKITNTYRNSQELIDVAGEFVGRNKAQFNKKLFSKKHLDKPIKLCYYDNNDPESCEKVLNNIIGKIYRENPNQKVLLLGRFNSDINNYVDSDYFKNGPYNRVICKDYPKLVMEFLTVHASKGLGYDQVIVLNAKNEKYGFPSQIEDEKIITVLDDEKDETIEFAEERRLFYVALTRTKNCVYFLAPNMPIDKRSDFIMEIRTEKNVVEDYSYIGGC